MVLSMDRWVGKVAIVTGTSAGIGAIIAKQLVEQGLKVVGLARRQDKLEQQAKQLAGEKGIFFPVKADVSKEEDILKAFKWVKENVGPVHILINNAATGTAGYVSDGDTETFNKIFKLNVIGLSIATREAIKNMKANKVNGHIIHINSIVGQRVSEGQGLSAYPASKFAVRALAETLRLELNSLKLKIKITNLSPGMTESEIIPAIFEKQSKELYEAGQIIEASNVADAVIYALSTPPHVQIQELIIRPMFDYTP